MNKPLISVIVPVYNVEAYLYQCVQSIISQSYVNIEILLIDDGSTDNSGAICDNFVAKDSRIRVFHQMNMGVSAARNVGLDRSVGDYVLFVDADDMLPKDGVEHLCEKMGPAMLAAGSIREFRGESSNGEVLLLPNRICSADEMLWYLFHEEELGYQGFMCNKLFDLRLIQEKHLRFDPSICYNEDRLFITGYLLHCTSVVLLADVVFFYRIHKDSAQGIIATAFTSTALTELDAFERVHALLVERYPKLASCVAQLCFEKALYWLSRIPKEKRTDRHKVRVLLHTNAKRCLINRNSGFVAKMKIVIHCLVEK